MATADPRLEMSEAGGCVRLRLVGLAEAEGATLQEAADAWGAETRSSRGGGDFVLVDEAAEQVAAVHVKVVRRRLCSDG
jgi:hypothetical protein